MRHGLPGLSVPDLIRDGVALLALFTTLGVTWDFSYHDGGDRWWVLISVLLSAASLSLPYLQRGGLLGALGASETQLIKWALNVPALISILVVLIDGLINFDDGGGFGGGVVLLSGAVALAMQPRAGEPTGAGSDSWWELAGRVLAIGGLVVAVVTTARWFLFTEGLTDYVAQALAVVLIAITGCLLFGIPLLRAMRHSFAGVVVLIAIGCAVLAAELLATMGDAVSSATGSFQGPFFTATAFFAAAVAVFASRPLMVKVQRERSAVEWVTVARFALGLAAIGCVLRFVVLVLMQSDSGSNWSGSYITTMVLVIAIAGASLASISMLQSDPARTRSLVTLVLSVALVLGVVALGVGGSADNSMRLTWIDLAAALALPGVAVGALTIPTPVREAFGPLYTPPAPTDRGA